MGMTWEPVQRSTKPVSEALDLRRPWAKPGQGGDKGKVTDPWIEPRQGRAEPR